MPFGSPHLGPIAPGEHLLARGPLATTLEEASRLMREHNVGCLIVLHHGAMVGIVTDRDLVTRGIAAH